MIPKLPGTGYFAPRLSGLELVGTIVSVTMRGFWAVMALGLALRGAFLLGTPTPPVPESDGQEYDAIAWNVASGRGFSVDGRLPTMARPPGYPAFLAAVYGAFGHFHWPVYVIQALMSLFNGWLLYRLCLLYQPPGVGLLACLLFMIFPGFIGYTKWLWSETLSTLLTTASCYWLARAAQSDRGTDFARAGFMMGLLTLTRPITLLWPAAFPAVAWLLGLGRRPLLNGAVYGFAFAATLLPWTLRNYGVCGRMIAVHSDMGLVLFKGNDLATGGTWSFHDEEPLKSLLAGGDPRDPEVSRRLTRHVIKLWMESPWAYLKSYLGRIPRMWLSGNTSWLRLAPPGASRADLRAEGRWGLLAFNAAALLAVVLLEALAAWQLLTRRDPINDLWLALLAYFTLFQAVFSWWERYPLPFWPLVMALSSQAILRLARRYTASRTSARKAA